MPQRIIDKVTKIEEIQDKIDATKILNPKFEKVLKTLDPKVISEVLKLSAMKYLRGNRGLIKEAKQIGKIFGEQIGKIDDKRNT